MNKITLEETKQIAEEAYLYAFPMLMGYRFAYATFLQPASPAYEIAGLARPLCRGWWWLPTAIAVGTLPFLLSYALNVPGHQLIAALPTQAHLGKRSRWITRSRKLSPRMPIPLTRWGCWICVAAQWYSPYRR